MKTATQSHLNISTQLTKLIDKHLDQIPTISGKCIVLNFRDPSYSAKDGGFRPVEIMMKNNTIQYITEFMYVGSGYMAELVKSVDFSFESNTFYDGYVEAPLYTVKDFFKLWESNFCSYNEMEIYTVSHESF